MGDGALGQMMEPISFDDVKKYEVPEKTWATTGTKMKRKRNIINSLYITPDELEELVWEREKKYDVIRANEARAEEYMTEDADYIIAAYGTTARIAKNAIKTLREQGIKAGLIRPITLWPFPSDVFNKAADTAKAFLSVEMSTGQMVEDVKLAVNGKKDVFFFGRTGGMVPTPAEIVEKIKEIDGGVK